ncbi:hypothetical protein [Agrobacterium tumefaciens]|uniref:hypothetical protein n=1 Tax=Agrobacterium tumefaciens TaxID=358 RepID=UPI00045B81E4|nr:hypothetical protein [Agrobacterium tumefaciens]CDN96058.1 hypothetical protein BN949_05232 [Agrobacterium tumefaciens]
MNAHASTAVADIKLQLIEDEPRALDLDIAKRLGFSKPTNIRNLIKRNLAELERFGVCFTAKQTHSGKGGRPTDEYWLNEEQSLLIAVLSDTENAAEVRFMIIKVFVAWRKGHLVGDVNPGHGDPGQQEFMFEEDGLQFFRAEVTRSGNEVTRTLEGVKLAIIGYVKKAISPSLLALSDKMQDFRDRTGRGLNTVNNNVKTVQGQLADLSAKFSPANGDRPVIMSEWYGCGRIYREIYGMEKMPRQGMLSAAVTRSLDAFVLRSRQNYNMTLIETNTAPSRAWHIDAVRPWFDQLGKRMIDQHVSNHSAPLFERKQS